MRVFFSLEGAMAEMEICEAVDKCLSEAIDEYKTFSVGRSLKVTDSEQQTIWHKLCHLLYLPILGLTRPRDLYYYQGDGLKVLHGFTYKYMPLEHFISQLTRLQVGYTLAKTLSVTFTQAWYAEDDPIFIFTDWHIKGHWTKHRAHSGHITMLNRIMPGTKQLLINGPNGHPLLGWNMPIDTHLTHVLVDLEIQLATAWQRPIRCNIFDSEGSGTPIAKRYEENELNYMTILPRRGDIGLDAFKVLSTWEPVLGDPIHEAAWAQWATQPKAAGDCRQLVLMRRVDDKDPTRIYVGRFGDGIKAGDLPTQFRQRWVCQEKVIRQLVNGANLNANFGYTYQQVENRTQKRRFDAADKKVERTEQQLNTHQQALSHQFDKLTQLKENYHKQQKEGKRQLNSLERKLLQRQDTGQPYRRCEQQIHRQKLQSVEKTTRYQKGRYRCHKDIETGLKKRVELSEKLSAQRTKRDAIDTETLCRERELDKDQIMLTLQLLLMNLHRWVASHYLADIFGSIELSTAIELIYRKPGRVRWGDDEIEVVLSCYRYPEHQQAIEESCQRFNAKHLRWRDGRFLVLSVEPWP
jgi:hypothetical protein